MPSRDIENRPLPEKTPSFKFNIEKCARVLGAAVKSEYVI